jgi:hypothetical protein
MNPHALPTFYLAIFKLVWSIECNVVADDIATSLKT